METTATLQQIFARCAGSVPTLRQEKIGSRKKRLRALRRWINDNRLRIHDAVFSDLGKPSVEADATEIFPALSEIRHALNSLDHWAAPRKIDAPLYMTGTRAWIHTEPRGLCLIISPWNYPFNLTAGPLALAIAAGNSVIIKPSEFSPNTSQLVREMCEEIFDPAVITVCEGDAETAQALLRLPFDHIFFTGSPTVGKKVMNAAANHLASVTLELGGKSPAIVADSSNITEAASRISVAKFINCGQTCIAPDYVLVHESVADDLVAALVTATRQMFGDERSPSYGRIVNRHHFSRIRDLLDDAVARGAKVAWDGTHDVDALRFHPVILTDPAPDSRIMQEEIFGPLLPIIRFRTTDEAASFVSERPNPLALYIFSGSRSFNHAILQATPSGTVCLNDCGIQFLHNHLPFGGVKQSGFGKSHGHQGFRAFSHEKSVLKQKRGFTTIRPFYPPYTRRTKRLMDWFLRMF